MNWSQVDGTMLVWVALTVFSVGVITGFCIPTIKRLLRNAGITALIGTGLLFPKGEYEIVLVWLGIFYMSHILIFTLGYFAGGSFRGYLSRLRMKIFQFR